VEPDRVLSVHGDPFARASTPATSRSETMVGYGGKVALMQNLMQALAKVR
jgi:hypothetical protein